MTAIPERLIDQARAVNVLTILGEYNAAFKKNRTTWIEAPCPRCGGTDRFAAKRDGGFHCRVCGAHGSGPIDLIAFLHGLDAKQDFRRIVEIITGTIQADNVSLKPSSPKAADDLKARRLAAWLWSMRRPAARTIVEGYLRVRGYHGALPATLGFLPAWRDRPPAMITAFGIPDEPEPGILAPMQGPVAIHRTFLKPDGGGKATIKINDKEISKQVIGRPGGLPIVIAPPNDLLGLAITEGIEDALTAHQATGLGAWAAYSSSNMPKLADKVPDYIEVVTIFAHDDKAGRDGASKLATALIERGIKQVLIEGLKS
jgi:hypothetical protein